MTGSTLKIERAEYVITVDPRRRILKNASVLVRDDRIVAIEPADQLADTDADRVIDGAGMVLTPGFVNTHEHLYGHGMRGVFSDAIDASYIAKACTLRGAFTDEDEYLATLGSLTEFIKFGTTCFVNPGDGRLAAAFKAYEQTGARVMVGQNYTDVPNPIAVEVYETAEALARLERVLDEYDGRCDGRVRAWVMLAYGTELGTEDLLVGAKRLADERGTSMTVHQSPRADQVESCLRAHGARPIEYLDRIGVLGPNMLLGHAIHLDANEIDVLARTDTKVSMSPITSVRLGFGTAMHGKLPEMLEAGVCVSLGTDSTDWGTGDMLNIASLTAGMYKDARMDTAVLSAEKALELITIDGARAAGLEDEIGSIEVGKKADLVLLDSRRLEWRPLLNPISNLIYNADGRDVHTVMVDGRVLIDGGRPTFVDEAALMTDLQEHTEALVERAGLSVEHRWPIE